MKTVIRKENYVEKRASLAEYEYMIMKLINKTHNASKKNFKTSTMRFESKKKQETNFIR